MTPKEPKKPKKSKKDYLRAWGFYKKDYEKPLTQLKLSKGVSKHLKQYFENFPASEGLACVGHPKIVARVTARLIHDLYKAGKIKNRVTVIDVPSILLQFSSSSFEAREILEANLISNLNNSDLVVFQEIALSQWNETQQARLYIMLQQRYAKQLPFFCTVSCDEGTFESHVGQSNFFRISDHCTFLEIKSNDS